MKIRNVSLVPALAMIALASFVVVPSAHAGEKYQLPVVIYSNSYYTMAEGILSDTRNSSDSTSYLSCGLYYNQGQPITGYCSARSATGQTAYCYTTDPPAVQVIASLHGDSFVWFDVNANSSVCSFVSTEQSS